MELLYIPILILLIIGVMFISTKLRIIQNRVSTLFWMQELQAEQAFGFVSGVWMSENTSGVKQRKKCEYVYTMILSLLFIGMTSLAFKQTPFMRELEGSWIYNLCQLLVKWPLSMMIIFLYLKHIYCKKIRSSYLQA